MANLIWWEALSYIDQVKPVRILGFTDKTVKLANGRKRSREADQEGIFPTYDDAVAWLRRKAEREIAIARGRLGAAERDLENLHTIPTEADLLAKYAKELGTGEGEKQ
jgi:predicted secreted Zn-dependent protease